MTKRIIIADDHDVVRRGLHGIIDLAPDLEIVAEARDGATAERLARQVRADLLILDIALPVKGGMQVLESLRAAGNRLPVLLFSIHPAVQYVHYARRRGAQGFIGKDESSPHFLRAVRKVLAGGTSFPRVRSFASASTVAPHPDFECLSPRETQIKDALVRGEALNAIAALLGVSAKSVTTYRRRLLDKLGLQTNAELIALAAGRAPR